jgi:hypothetical protein
MPAGASAQTARDINQEWCRQARIEIRLYEKAVEELRAEREQGIAKLPMPVQQQQARRNLYSWYWKRLALVERNTKIVDDECNDPTRIDPREDVPKVATTPSRRTLPVPGRTPRRIAATPSARPPLVYPAYQSRRGGGTYDPR